jgi:two-component system, NtrC family, response regulator AtoC
MSLERVLVIDDEPLVTRTLEKILRARGVVVATAASIMAARPQLEQETFDLVMLDVRLPDGDGQEFLEHIVSLPAHPLVVMITGHGTIQSAVACMRIGAFDYLIKPFEPAQIDLLLRRAGNYSQLIKVNRYFNERDATGEDDLLVGGSRAMYRVQQLIDRVAPTDATVLITGENGSGKEMVAREIFRKSSRRQEPYIKVNCAVLSEQLIESELFGHERGAFTGAIERREGRFELANRGTLLLDEVSELPVNLQAKLLRVLQEREFERVGGTKTIKVNVRILATSNRDLQEFVNRGLFRSDLYYRLNVFPLVVPSLRERVEDVIYYAETFLRRFARKHRLRIPGFTDHALAALRAYPWPGNVRELQNTVERAVILAEDGRPITAVGLNLPQQVPARLGQAVAHAALAAPAALSEPEPLAAWTSSRQPPAEPEASQLDPTVTDAPPPESVADEATEVTMPAPSLAGRPLSEIEKEAILDTLASTRGNRNLTAEQLGISIRTLRNKLNEYRIEEGLA